MFWNILPVAQRVALFLSATISASGATEETAIDGATYSFVVPAIVAALVTILISWHGSRRSTVDRQREVFAEAYAVLFEYREFPFIVLRRERGDGARESERVRISSELSSVQARINRYQGLLSVESARVAKAFEELVKAMRDVAGRRIKEAWEAELSEEADYVHCPDDWDFSGLDAPQAQFLQVARDHLRSGSYFFVPAWLCRSVRFLSRKLASLNNKQTSTPEKLSDSTE